VRRRYVDLARGLAVLMMIEAHTLDAWTRPADRSTVAFRNLTVLGGFAAPLFLWLAGMALVLSAESRARRAGSRRASALAVVRRGLEIFILAFLFRLQAFIVSPGSPAVTLFRVDILNVMGPSIVAAGLLWGLVENRSALTLVYAMSAIVVAMLTPIVRSAACCDLRRVGGPSCPHHARPAREAGPELVVRLLDPRRARLRVCSMAHSSTAGALGGGCGLRDFLRAHVRRGAPPRSHRRPLARRPGHRTICQAVSA
jgi:hypothetical protein